MTLVHGRDSSSNVVPLLLDANGNVIVSASQLTTTGGKIKVDSDGHLLIDGESPSLFRPIPKSGRFSNTSLVAGSSTHTVVTVPASEYWRIAYIVVLYIGTVAGVTLYVDVNNGTTNLRVNDFNPVVSNHAHTSQTNIILPPGGVISVTVTGATLNDDLHVDYFAERIY